MFRSKIMRKHFASLFSSFMRTLCHAKISQILYTTKKSVFFYFFLPSGDSSSGQKTLHPLCFLGFSVFWKIVRKGFSLSQARSENLQGV